MTNKNLYDRVYILGVDGAGNFFQQASTPNIDRIFEHGSVTHNALTGYPTISAQCWGTLLHGVTPQAHRFTNGLVGDFPVPEDHPYPSIFKQARKFFPDAVMASVSNWNPINTGIIEDGLDIIKETGSDEEVCEKVCEIIKNNDPKILFVQFDSVDGAGHCYGYGAQKYLEQITYADGLIGKIYDQAEECGRTENLLLIVTADHGGSPDGHHGDDSKAEITISYFVKGKSVIHGCPGYTEIRDTAAITAFALGFDLADTWSSRIPDGLFIDAEPFERPSEAAKDGSKRYSGRTNLPTPTANGKSLSDYINSETLRCYFPFDGTACDDTGKCRTETEGKIYFTEGFYGKCAVMDDCRIKCAPVHAGTDYYTLCCWLKLNSLSSDKERLIFSTMKDENDKGLSFFIKGNDLCHNIGLGNGTVSRYSHPLPANYDGNWFHFICSYDRKDDELCYYYDFALETDRYCDIKIPRDLELNGSETVIADHSPIMIDDLMVFDHKLSDPEIDSLQKYYEQT